MEKKEAIRNAKSFDELLDIEYGKAELLEKDLKPMSLDQLHNEIDQAMEDSKNDRVIKASDLKAKIQKWS